MINSELLLAIGWFIVGVALLLNVRHLNRSLPALSGSVNETNADLPSLALIVPARNEAHQIERCLASFLAQGYPADLLRIVVVDDDSTNAPAEVARRLAACDTRLRVIHAPALPGS